MQPNNLIKHLKLFIITTLLLLSIIGGENIINSFYKLLHYSFLNLTVSRELYYSLGYFFNIDDSSLT